MLPSGDGALESFRVLNYTTRNINGEVSLLNLFQMEELYDQQEKILEEKLKSMRLLMYSLENNVIAADRNGDAPKRRHEVERVNKQFRFHVTD